MDFLSLIPEPLTVTTGNFLARDLVRGFKRLERLQTLAAGKGFVLAPRRVHTPNLSKLDALDRKLRGFPTRRRLLTVKEFALYLDALRQMRRSVAGLARQVRRYNHNASQERYLGRVGRLFLDAPADVLERFILNRGNRAGSNLHAVALARMRNDGLPREKLAEWGSKGAQARWEKRPATTVEEGSISSPAGSSLNQDRASSGRASM
jgi:hypothetical protein